MTRPPIPDVDIDLKNRDAVVLLFPEAIQATQIERQQLLPHKTGVYFQNIPIDPVTGRSAFMYEDAETLGYYKVDFLPNHIYDKVESMQELDALLTSETDWSMFERVEFVKSLFHFGGMVTTEIAFAEVVAHYRPSSIMDLAVLVALKMPAKRYLIGEDWSKITDAIWVKEENDKARFKKSHAVAYAMAVLVDAKLKHAAIG